MNGSWPIRLGLSFSLVSTCDAILQLCVQKGLHLSPRVFFWQGERHVCLGSEHTNGYAVCDLIYHFSLQHVQRINAFCGAVSCFLSFPSLAGAAVLGGPKSWVYEL